MIKEIFQFGDELPWLFRMFGDAGFTHLLMEPLFTYGIGFGLLLFIVALAAKEKKSRTLGLLILIICSAAMYPYQVKRNEGAPRPQPEYRSYWRDDTPRTLWDQQTERRRYWSKLYYGMAFLCLVGLIAPPEAGGLGKVASLAIVAVGAGLLVVSLWLNLHEKQIFHPDLQYDRFGRRITMVDLGQPPAQVKLHSS